MLQRLSATLDGLGIGRRAQMFVLGGAGLALLWGVWIWATAPTYVPAYSGVELTDAAAIVSRLDELGIDHRYERGGTEILVPADKLVEARIALAENGAPAAGRPGLELFDRPSWGMTDFAQRVNYRRALEGELERTISRMTGVQGVTVHLALHETSAFRRSDQPAEASVVLSTNRVESTSMVRGITYLVASAVDRLDSEHVTVVGANGRVLSASTESEGGAALSSRQLETQREVERHLEEQATRVLSPIVGPENVDVRVAATLNFDQLARTVQAVDPDAQVVVGEERSEIIPSEGATGAASVQSNTTFDGTRSVEQFTQGQGGVERLTVAVLVNARPVEAADGSVTFEDRTPEELARIESLVRNSVGVDAGRGDQVSVVSVPFTAVPGFEAPVAGPISMVFDWLQLLQKPVLSVLALLLMFVVAMKTLRSVKELPTPEPLAVQAGAGADMGRALGGTPAAVGPGGMRPGLEAAGAGFGGFNETAGYRGGGGPGESSRQQIAARVVEDPQTAARAAGQWLRGG